ncbi:MAG: carboxypeptidase M32 [Tenericutes bacterium HGW-Tenericutes-6]|nr:MAG: carboxypeptidase M32 [Tenericutes bacterium HGW-Tenericutes-6]
MNIIYDIIDTKSKEKGMYMEKYLNVYKETRKKIKAYSYFGWLMSWDQETEAPELSVGYRTKQYQVFAEELYKIQSDPAYVEAIEYLYEHINEIEDADFKVEIKNGYKDLRWVKKVPKEELLEYRVLTSQASHIWAKAKQADDFDMFAPTLEKIVAFNRKLVKYLETDTLKGYDILLDMYEEGFGTKEYDLFFNTLREELVPFVLEVTKGPKRKFNRKLKKAIYPASVQREFSQYLIDVFNYDRKRGLLKESAHPFTSGVSSKDTRITTHYHEDNLPSSIFSTIHEMGHAIYELQNDEKYDDTFLHGGTSLGIHESQSRMYENMIGRSLAFWKLHYPKLQSLFPKQLKDISVDEFHAYINQAERSLIRIEADELTYSLHIMVRYEIEKELINGRLKVRDLPKKWKTLMSKYVGKRPTTNKEGVLQDIHWSGGAFGYFPTYALGSAYAAQMYDFMNQSFNVEDAIANNDIKKINEWNRIHIHQYASSKTPKEIIKLSTGKAFDPYYYVNYLKNKFKNI